MGDSPFQEGGLLRAKSTTENTVQTRYGSNQFPLGCVLLARGDRGKPRLLPIEGHASPP